MRNASPAFPIYICIYIYIYICIYIYIYIYTYIYRYRYIGIYIDRRKERYIGLCLCIFMDAQRLARVPCSLRFFVFFFVLCSVARRLWCWRLPNYIYCIYCIYLYLYSVYIAYIYIFISIYRYRYRYIDIDIYIDIDMYI